MANAFVMMGIICLFVGIITAMDQWTQRQDRRRSMKRDRPL